MNHSGKYKFRSYMKATNGFVALKTSPFVVTVG
jgi:hypothetical protein